MTDTDKLLEAEQSIHDMATELSRMRDAANLLTASQTQVEQVLKSAQSVIATSKNFAEQCKAIISNLSSTDLGQMVDALKKLRKDLDELPSLFQTNFEWATKEHKKQCSEIMQEMVRQSDKLQRSIGESAETLKHERRETKDQLTDLQDIIHATDDRLTKFEEYTRSSQTAFGVILGILVLLNLAILSLVAIPFFYK